MAAPAPARATDLEGSDAPEELLLCLLVHPEAEPCIRWERNVLGAPSLPEPHHRPSIVVRCSHYLQLCDLARCIAVARVEPVLYQNVQEGLCALGQYGPAPPSMAWLFWSDSDEESYD